MALGARRASAVGSRVVSVRGSLLVWSSSGAAATLVSSGLSRDCPETMEGKLTRHIMALSHLLAAQAILKDDVDH